MALALGASAHPGEHEEEHIQAIAAKSYKDHTRRALESCANHLKARGVTDRAIARRSATAQRHSKRSEVILERDTESVLNTSHHSSLTGITADTADDVIFSSNTTCVLNPEGEVGPYYVKGEYIRTDLREDEPGVPIVIEAQFINVDTCEPITDLYWDVWNCNSTGVYSGLVATGNGNVDDESNLNNTALRGIQKADDDGVVQFLSVFPGHYSGRTTHHHMVAHTNVTVLPNNTILAGNVPHIGQLFWDQDIITEVEATYPYNTNDVTLTTNAEDRIFAGETEDTTSDPVFEYVYLGSNISDGLFGWVTVGINLSATYEPSYSFIYTADGGEAVDTVGTDIPN